MIDWELHGIEFGNCNCDYACPCQFNGRPNRGFCEASVGTLVERGHYGEVRLEGVRAAVQYQWPGAVHEGNGTMQLYLDDRASPEQRDAMLAIMTGADTDEAATMWWIFAAMCPTKLEPKVVRIETEIDVPARRGRVVVAGGFETTGRPILNPVTGKEHRVRIDLPEGFEYAIAEIGSASTRSEGPLAINLDDSYGQFCELHMNNRGVIRAAA
jgi:hypothetical protein